MTFNDMLELDPLPEEKIEDDDSIEQIRMYGKWAVDADVDCQWISRGWYTGRIAHELEDHPHCYFINFNDGDRGHCRHDQIKSARDQRHVQPIEFEDEALGRITQSLEGNISDSYFSLAEIFYRDWHCNVDADGLRVYVEFDTPVYLDRIRIRNKVSPNQPGYSSEASLAVSVGMARDNLNTVFDERVGQLEPFRDISIQTSLSTIKLHFRHNVQISFGPIRFFKSQFLLGDFKEDELDLSAYFEDREYCNAVISAQGVEIPVNEELLRIKSPVLDRLFDESNDHTVVLEEHPPDVLRKVLLLAYHKKDLAIDSYVEALDLYRCANALYFAGVLTQVEKYLVNVGTVEVVNAIGGDKDGIVEEYPELYPAAAQIVLKLLEDGSVSREEMRGLLKPWMAHALNIREEEKEFGDEKKQDN